MKHHCWFVLAIIGILANNTFAQATAPVADPDAGSASEPTFEPERVAGTKPAEPAAGSSGPDEALTLDRLVLSSVNRIDLNFFGDASLQQLKGEKLAFVFGPLGFQVTAHLSDRLIGRTEFVLEDGGVDVERAYLEYRATNWAFSAGRTHAELGYWNTAFHHGRWLQLTINRPHVLRFEDEGGVLPVHSVGVNLSYGPQRGDSGLELAIGVGNGHGSTIDQIQNEGDNNLAKAVLVRVGAVGIGHPALRFGVNVAIDNIAPENAMVRPRLPDKAIFELITGVYLALRAERLMVFTETYNVLHTGGGQFWQITDGFLIAGYRFGQFIPYGGFEARYGDGLIDPFYNPAPGVGSPESVAPGNFVEGTAGLRYELGAWSALKLELSAGSFENTTDYRAEINWSFGR